MTAPLLRHAVEEGGGRCDVYVADLGLVVAPAYEFLYGPLFLAVQVERRVRWLWAWLHRDPALQSGVPGGLGGDRRGVGTGGARRGAAAR